MCFLLLLCARKTHIHTPHVPSNAQKKKECMGRHITIKLLYTGQDVTRQRVTGRMISFPHRLVFWCHKLPLSQTLPIKLCRKFHFISKSEKKLQFQL